MARKQKRKNPHAVALGRLGGLVCSEAKKRASKENGRKGGLVKSRGACRSGSGPRARRSRETCICKAVAEAGGSSAHITSVRTSTDSTWLRRKRRTPRRTRWRRPASSIRRPSRRTSKGPRSRNSVSPPLSRTAYRIRLGAVTISIGATSARVNPSSPAVVSAALAARRRIPRS